MEKLVWKNPKNLYDVFYVNKMCILHKFLKRRHTYEKIDDDIELVEHRYVVRDIYYQTRKRVKNLSNIIMFHHDGLQINGAFVRYEYIPVIKRIGYADVLLPTFTDIVNGKIQKADTISHIYIRFDSVTEMKTFVSNIMSKMVYVKDIGIYDKSVFSLKSAKKFCRK